MKPLSYLIAGLSSLLFLGAILLSAFLGGRAFSDTFLNDLGLELSIFTIAMLLAYLINADLFKPSTASVQERNTEMIKTLKVYAVLSILSFLVLNLVMFTALGSTYIFSFLFIVNLNFWVLGIMLFRMKLSTNIILNLCLVIIFFEMSQIVLANLNLLGAISESLISHETFEFINSNIVVTPIHFPLVLGVFFIYFKNTSLKPFLLKMIVASIVLNLLDTGASMIISSTLISHYVVYLSLELLLILGFVYKSIEMIKGTHKNV